MQDIKPYDPCGHVKLAVSDYAKSYTFYKELFAELGYKQVSNKDTSAAWTSNDGYGVLIAQAKITDYKYQFDAPGLHHLCLKAHNTQTVDKVYQSILKKGVNIFNAPKKYPNYTDKYYATYFADPDGIKLEVAFY